MRIARGPALGIGKIGSCLWQQTAGETRESSAPAAAFVSARGLGLLVEESGPWPWALVAAVVTWGLPHDRCRQPHTHCSPRPSAMAEVGGLPLQDPPLALLLLFCSKIQFCQHFLDVWSWPALMRVLQAYGCWGWLEVTQTYIFISSSEQWQHQPWQRAVRKVSRCGRRNKPGLAEMCRRRSNNFSWNHARELGMFLCQSSAEHGKWRRTVAGSFWELSQSQGPPASSPAFLAFPIAARSLSITCFGKLWAWLSVFLHHKAFSEKSWFLVGRSSVTGKHLKTCFFQSILSWGSCSGLSAFVFTEHWTVFALLLHY